MKIRTSVLKTLCNIIKTAFAFKAMLSRIAENGGINDDTKFHLRGFCPDPSIIRVEEDYYIATSTFGWWPGVKLFHSRDLKHWEQIPSPL